MPVRARSSRDKPSAIKPSAVAIRWAVSLCACASPAAKPLRCACASASAARRSASTKVMVGLPPVVKSSLNVNFAIAVMLVDQLFVAAALGDQDFALGRQILGSIDQ